MSETKHTPGPWRAAPYSSIVGCPITAQPRPDKNSIRIAGVAGPIARVEIEANARLIAAAPTLLSIAKRWAALDGGRWLQERYAREKAELLADTAAAIAKAEGRS